MHEAAEKAFWVVYGFASGPVVYDLSFSVDPQARKISYSPCSGQTFSETADHDLGWPTAVGWFFVACCLRADTLALASIRDGGGFWHGDAV